MGGRLEASFSKSFAYDAEQYYNTGSGTLTLTAGSDNDAEGRTSRSVNSGANYLVETQAAASNDLMRPTIATVGSKGRWYLAVRGVGHLGVYVNGTSVTTTVDFDTDDLWSVVDTGENVVRDFGETLSLRVWGAADVHVGALYYLHRAITYDAVDVLVGSPPNTTTVTDTGLTVAATVAQYQRATSNVGGPADDIISFTPGIDPSEDIVPLQLARGYSPGSPPGTESDPTEHDDGNSLFASSTTRNGTQFGSNNPAVVAVSTESIQRVTPCICSCNHGGQAPGTSNSAGETTFDSDDVLDIYIGNSISGDFDEVALLDQIVLVRGCASAFFDAYNDDAASSFEYSWSGFDAPIDHYRIVVTDQAGDADGGEGNVLQDIDPVTSPHTVSGLSGAVRVYILAVTADGSFSCYDYDEETVAAVAAVNMTAWIGR